MGELVILHISFQTKCFLALVTFIWAFCTVVFRYEIASIFLCQIELSTESKDYAGFSEETSSQASKLRQFETTTYRATD